MSIQATRRLRGVPRRALQTGDVSITQIRTDGNRIDVSWRASFATSGNAEIEVNIVNGQTQRQVFRPFVTVGETVTRDTTFITDIDQPTEFLVTVLIIAPEEAVAQAQQRVSVSPTADIGNGDTTEPTNGDTEPTDGNGGPGPSQQTLVLGLAAVGAGILFAATRGGGGP